MTPETIVLLMFVGIVIGIFSGFPIAFALAGLGIIFGLVGWGPHVFALIGSKTFTLTTNYTLIAIPLFIFMGHMLSSSGIADEAYNVMSQWLRKVKGGLAYATVIICTLFAACTGIVGASVTTMGLLALPAMVNRGYNKSLACGVVSSGGTLGILIPPSIMLIMYGPISGVSVVKLFSAAFIPGFILAALYMFYIFIAIRVKKDQVPTTEEEEMYSEKKYTLFEGLITFVPIMFLILAVLGAIFFGIAAATEAAAVGALGSIIIAIAYKRFTWSSLKEAAVQTLETSAMIMYVAIGANLFTGVFFAVGGSGVVENFVTNLGFGPYGVLALFLLIIFFLGMIIDWVGIFLLILPIFLPIIYSYGLNPLWVGMLVCIVMQTSFLTPPYALSLFYLKGIAPKGVTINHIYKGVIPFVLIQLLFLFFCIIFPKIILWLPEILG